MKNADKTECSRGHPYNEVNTYITPSGVRQCRACRPYQRSKTGVKGLGQFHAQKTHCKNGHEYTEENTLRTANGTRRCRTCRNASSRRYKAGLSDAVVNLEDMRSTCRNGHELNPETILVWSKILVCPECNAAVKFRHRLRRYGLTEEQYYSMLAQQEGRCAICESAFEDLQKTPHIDHDHDTGQVRGLLCGKCNSGIGYLQDDLGLVRAAASYLARYADTAASGSEDRA
jgi:hypothetical protein